MCVQSAGVGCRLIYRSKWVRSLFMQPSVIAVISSNRHMPRAFSLKGFLGVLGKLAKRGGREIVYQALTLFLCFRDATTPAWAKSVIIGALGYLIFPLDFIPDALLGLGFTDDWGVILGALAAVAAHVKTEHRAKAAAITERVMVGKSLQDIINPSFSPRKNE